MMTKILRRVGVPTGDILVVSGERGPLEMVSLGDYGKDVNLKADCLGLSRDPGTVRHTHILPLEDKWVLTISTQYGCPQACMFCDVPGVRFNGNATAPDMRHQIETGLALHPDVTKTRRLNIHFARMGEPTWNPAVLDVAHWLKRNIDPTHHTHPVVSTMMPRANKWLSAFISGWVHVKNDVFGGEAGLQLSINSTDDHERDVMFGGGACNLGQIANIMAGHIPDGRKFTLNFAVAEYTVDANVLLQYFSPEHFIVKLTPMHQTFACAKAGIRTCGDATTLAPYAAIEEACKNAGYDVIVFIASKEEDESRITCGNLVLADNR